MAALRLVSTLALIAVAGSAAANGGPVEIVPRLAGRGTIQPLEESQVQLVSERLSLSIPDAGIWHARAEYQLDNPGPARSLLFGVPAPWAAFEFDGAPPAPSEAIIEGAKLIQIVFQGSRVPCRPYLDAQAPAGRWPEKIETWCVARIAVPKGRGLTLSLEYDGWVRDIGRVDSPAGAGRISYTLAPAGYWRGRIRSLSLEFDPGPFAGQVKVVWPPYVREENGRYRWEGADLDLRKLGPVVLDVQNRRRSRKWSGGGWLRASANLTAKASSTLAPYGKHDYSAARAIDGDWATAWCEGVKGSGLGESLEIAIDVPGAGDRECRLLDFELVPGLSVDDTLFRANGRLMAGRLERCDDPKDGFDFDLSDSKWDPNVWAGLRDDTPAAFADQEITIPSGVLGGVPACVRLVIGKVKPGSKYADTCVSELTPRVYCKPRAATEDRKGRTP